MLSLQKLQALIQQRNKGSQSDGITLTSLVPDIVTDDTYMTLMLGVQLGVVDANELLIQSIESTVSRGGDFFQLIGLALRNGANPNIYVTIKQVDGNLGIVHILYYTWMITPKTVEDLVGRDGDFNRFEALGELQASQSLMLDAMSLLIVAGSDAKMAVVDPALLVERRRSAGIAGQESPQNVSQAKVFTEVGRPIDVKTLIEGDDIDTSLTDEALDRIYYYTVHRSFIGEYAQYMIDEDGQMRRNLALDIIQLLDMPDNLVADPNVLSSCISVHANKCASKVLESNQAVFEDAQSGFLEALDAYNLGAAIKIIRSGFMPRYNYIDRVILRAKDKAKEGLPVSAAVMNRVLVEFAERGFDLDNEQLKLIGSYSKSTYEHIKKIMAVPYWQRTCSAVGNYIRPDLKRLARELNLPTDSSKQDICRTFGKLGGSSQEVLQRTAAKLQHKRLEARSSSVGSVLKYYAQSEPKPQGHMVCSNANMLSRPEHDYADIDITMFEDDGNTYCFESTDYESLLKEGLNPITGNRVPRGALEEMEAKLQTIQAAALPVQTSGIQASMRKLVGMQPENENPYDDFIRARTEEFERLARASNIDLADLTPEQMESVAQQVSNQNSRFNLASREHSRRALAETIMELVDEISTDEDLNAIFDDLGDSVAAATNL